jgi:hypothetical protein
MPEQPQPQQLITDSPQFSCFTVPASLSVDQSYRSHGPRCQPDIACFYSSDPIEQDFSRGPQRPQPTKRLALVHVTRQTAQCVVSGTSYAKRLARIGGQVRGR